LSKKTKMKMNVLNLKKDIFGIHLLVKESNFKIMKIIISIINSIILLKISQLPFKDQNLVSSTHNAKKNKNFPRFKKFMRSINQEKVRKNRKKCLSNSKNSNFKKNKTNRTFLVSNKNQIIRHHLKLQISIAQKT
jgi:hypothetical protein